MDFRLWSGNGKIPAIDLFREAVRHAQQFRGLPRQVVRSSELPRPQEMPR